MANSVDPDQILPSAVSDLGLHCLLRPVFPNTKKNNVVLFSGYRIVNRMREKLFSSIMRQEVGFFDKTKTGELINRLSTDTSLVGQSVTMNISDGLRAVAQAIGSVGMMVR